MCFSRDDRGKMKYFKASNVFVILLCLLGCSRKPTQPEHTNIYDINNTTYIHPQLISTIHVPYSYHWFNIVDTLAYLVSYSGQLSVFNIANPYNAYLVKTKNLNIDQFGLMAFCADNDIVCAAGQPGKLNVFSFSDTMPLVASIDQWQIDDMILKDKYLYAANANIGYGLDVYDVNVPGSINLICRLPNNYYFGVIKFVNDTAYIVQDNRVRCVDISNPATVHLIRDYIARSSISNIALSGDIIYTLEDANAVQGIPGGLVKYRILNDFLREEVRDENYAESQNYLDICGNYIFILSYTNIHILTAPADVNPKEIGRYSHHDINGMKIKGDFIFANCSWKGDVFIIKYR